MTNTPISERPEAKLAYFGPSALTNAELLTLVLKSAPKGKTKRDVAEDIFTYTNENFVDLMAAEVCELQDVYGVGESNAATIVAAMELGRRMASDKACRQYTRIRDVRQIADIMMSDYGSERREFFVAFYLNSKLQIESQHVVSIGNLDSAPVHPREVFSPAVKRSASAVIVAHNHPSSGDPSPSPQDIQVTERLRNASEILGIRLLDHVIVGNGNYTSMKDEGYLKGGEA